MPLSERIVESKRHLRGLRPEELREIQGNLADKIEQDPFFVDLVRRDVGPPERMTGNVKIHHKGTTILVDEAGKVTITAEPQIDVNCQGAQVTMSGGKVAINAPSEIVLAVGQSGLKISASGVEITGPNVKTTALTGTNEITGLLVKLN